MKKGKSVVCVEAMSRKGGRCFTDTSIFGVPYDLGGHWLHNFNFNQIAKYGKKQKDTFDIYKDPDKVLIYDGPKKITGMKVYSMYKKLGKLKRGSKNDVPLVEKVKPKWLENEWFATAHQLRFACSSGKDISDYDRDNLMDEKYDTTELGLEADEKIRTFQADAAKQAGIFHHLITLPTYHTAALSTDNLAKEYFGDEGMLGYVKGVQRKEIR